MVQNVPLWNTRNYRYRKIPHDQERTGIYEYEREREKLCY